MIGIELSGVTYGMGTIPNGVVLAFQDPQSGIQTRVLFDQDAWRRFQRFVEKDGMVPDIVIANGQPRMDVPRGG